MIIVSHEMRLHPHRYRPGARDGRREDRRGGVTAEVFAAPRHPRTRSDPPPSREGGKGARRRTGHMARCARLLRPVDYPMEDWRRDAVASRFLCGGKTARSRARIWRRVRGHRHAWSDVRVGGGDGAALRGLDTRCRRCRSRVTREPPPDTTRIGSGCRSGVTLRCGAERCSGSTGNDLDTADETLSVGRFGRRTPSSARPVSRPLAAGRAPLGDL